MRLNINLASQPYEAARFYRRRMGCWSCRSRRGDCAACRLHRLSADRNRADINRQMAEVRREINGLDFEEAQARAILNKPVNRDIADQSEFLNELFARKALSWTRVFTEMERIVPPNLHVVSMKPEYTKTNDLMLRVVVATDSRDRAVELVRRMEKSNHFRQSQVVAENVTANSSDQSAGPGNIQFDIAAIYIPNRWRQRAAADDDKDKDKDKEQNARGKSKRPGQGGSGSGAQLQSATGQQFNPSAERVATTRADEAALMASIREIRKTLMPVVIALAVIDLACIGYILSPAGKSRQARQRDYYEQRAKLTAKREQVLPTRGMDVKLIQAKADINKFYADRLPTEYSAGGGRVGQGSQRYRCTLCGREVRRQRVAHRRLAQDDHRDSPLRRLPPGSQVHQ